MKFLENVRIKHNKLYGTIKCKNCKQKVEFNTRHDLDTHVNMEDASLTTTAATFRCPKCGHKEHFILTIETEINVVVEKPDKRKLDIEEAKINKVLKDNRNIRTIGGLEN